MLVTPGSPHTYTSPIHTHRKDECRKQRSEVQLLNPPVVGNAKARGGGIQTSTHRCQRYGTLRVKTPGSNTLNLVAKASVSISQRSMC